MKAFLNLNLGIKTVRLYDLDLALCFLMRLYSSN